MVEKPSVDINRCGLSYSGKVVIVTGGSKGIGEGCARVFVDAGAKVVICARGAKDGEARAKELTGQGPGTCSFIPCDVCKPVEVRNVIDKTVDLHGRLDCLINNAGQHPPHKHIDKFSVEDLVDLFQINFVSCFVATQQALPHLRKTKGNIVNIGSLVSLIGQECATTYCAVKSSMNGFTKSLAIEESRNGVRVNIILPGNLLSYGRMQLLETEEGAEYYHWIDTNQPGGKSGTNEDAGQLALFLACNSASFITGAEFNLSAGAELGYGIKFRRDPVESAGATMFTPANTEY